MVTGWVGGSATRRGDALTVMFDGDCGVCTHAARVLARLDRSHRLRLVPLQSVGPLPLDSPPRDEFLRVMHARDEDGEWFSGGAAFVEIARRIPVFWPLSLVARLPLAMRLVNAGYQLVARNRHRISRKLGLDVCLVRSPVRPPGSAQASSRPAR